jgi:hypothetical protein
MLFSSFLFLSLLLSSPLFLFPSLSPLIEKIIKTLQEKKFFSEDETKIVETLLACDQVWFWG